MTQSSRDKCPPVDDAPVAKQPLSHAGADGRAQARSMTPIARIVLKRVAASEAEAVIGSARVAPADRPQLSETELTDREHQRRSMSPFRPGSRVRIIPRRVGEHHTLDKLTLWRRPGPHARQINLWWREHRSEQWYRDMRKQELHSVQYAYLTQATVVSFLVCPETGQRWVALLLDGGRGLGWTYAIDALELV